MNQFAPFPTKPNKSENRKRGKKKLLLFQNWVLQERLLFGLLFSFDFGWAFVSRLKLAYSICFLAEQWASMMCWLGLRLKLDWKWWKIGLNPMFGDSLVFERFWSTPGQFWSDSGWKTLLSSCWNLYLCIFQCRLLEVWLKTSRYWLWTNKFMRIFFFVFWNQISLIFDLKLIKTIAPSQ